MFDCEGFIAKAKLYFQRASTAEGDDARAVWQLLGFEFVLRAPLAKVHPALLASPDDSLLHAVGVTVQASRATSIASSLVISRLEKVIPLGQDRARAAHRVLGVRNHEIHSSEAAVASTPRQEWLPAMLDVLEDVCEYLKIPVTELLPQDQLEEATEYRETARDEIRGKVTGKIKKAKDFVDQLVPDEISARLATSHVSIDGSITCPACKQESMERLFGPPRVTKSAYIEEDGEIAYEFTKVVSAAKCDVCGLSLDTTAEVIAADIPRACTYEASESRYEGWRDAISMSEIEEVAEMARGYWEPEYMDE